MQFINLCNWTIYDSLLIKSLSPIFCLCYRIFITTAKIWNITHRLIVDKYLKSISFQIMIVVKIWDFFFLADCEIPQFDSLVVTARDNVKVVELQTGNSIRVRSEIGTDVEINWWDKKHDFKEHHKISSRW